MLEQIDKVGDEDSNPQGLSNTVVQELAVIIQVPEEQVKPGQARATTWYYQVPSSGVRYFFYDKDSGPR